MSWREIRREARAAVHDAFGVSADYLAVSGGSPIPVMVRVHSRATPGSVAYARREAFAEVAEESVRVITSWPGVTRGDVFQVADFIRDDGTTGAISLRVDHVLPTEGDGFWTCLVSEVRA